MVGHARRGTAEVGPSCKTPAVADLYGLCFIVTVRGGRSNSRLAPRTGATQGSDPVDPCELLTVARAVKLTSSPNARSDAALAGKIVRAPTGGTNFPQPEATPHKARFVVSARRKLASNRDHS